MTAQEIRWRLLPGDDRASSDPGQDSSDLGEDLATMFDERHRRFAQKPARRTRKPAPGQLPLFGLDETP